MTNVHASMGRILWVYVLVCAAVLGVTQLERIAVVGECTHVVVAGIFLLTAIRQARGQVAHFGVALGGLLEPPTDDRPRGPLGMWDLGRALRAALPSAVTELGVALAVVAVVFPLYAIGFYSWNEPSQAFALSLPPGVGSLALAQLLIVALPEEAFFRGYLQTALTDLEQRRVRVLGVEIAPAAWIAQALLFALIHLMVEPYPARLAVFFPGLLFGWVRAWRGGIGAAMAVHAMSNLYSEILSRSWL